MVNIWTRSTYPNLYGDHVDQVQLGSKKLRARFGTCLPRTYTFSELSFKGNGCQCSGVDTAIMDNHVPQKCPCCARFARWVENWYFANLVTTRREPPLKWGWLHGVPVFWESLTSCFLAFLPRTDWISTVAAFYLRRPSLNEAIYGDENGRAMRIEDRPSP